MDILDRLRLKIQRIPAGSCHTCNDACTNTDCLLVTSRQEIEDLRAERDELIGMREEVLHYQREFHRLRDERDEAVALLRHVEVTMSTAGYCYANRPENFALALRDLRLSAAEARAFLAKIGRQP